MNKARSTIRKDLAIFADPGFLITLVLLLALFAAGTAILIYASEKYGIPVLRLSAGAAAAVG